MNSISSGIRRRIWYVSTTNKGEEEACQLGKGWEYFKIDKFSTWLGQQNRRWYGQKQLKAPVGWFMHYCWHTSVNLLKFCWSQMEEVWKECWTYLIVKPKVCDRDHRCPAPVWLCQRHVSTEVSYRYGTRSTQWYYQKWIITSTDMEYNKQEWWVDKEAGCGGPKYKKNDVPST